MWVYTKNDKLLSKNGDCIANQRSSVWQKCWSRKTKNWVENDFAYEFTFSFIKTQLLYFLL